MSTELILASVIFVVIGLILVGVFMLTKFLGPKNENSQLKNSVYESGVSNPIGTSNIRFSVKFYSMWKLFLCFLGL
jgi:NADH-quinone oxidoreductase subunit A